jgi:hypothetical protein
MNMFWKILKKKMSGLRPRYVTLDAKAYKIPIPKMDNVLEMTKSGKVLVNAKEYGLCRSDVIMSFWAYVNNKASYNLRYGCYPAWQDINECEDELNFERNLFFD